MRKRKKDYAIGYRKPPTRTQFKKGQSGNPAGRPKKKPKTFLADLDAALNELVLVNENGHKKYITKRNALTKQLSNMAAKGNLKAAKILLDLIAAIEQARGVTSGAELGVNHQSVRERMMKKLDEMAERIQARAAREAASKENEAVT